ncbi:TetR/AcrR family transcriptional regulator [Paenibacillus sp. JCM 10914]|uniref:TetR family transcriptional regulator n=1 Tax=Paenibacillus sp. JCM 10914 TaxID=1236974 RepID=UPI0003CCB92B|nr:TetR family transcriptional regulator [Paenibacillus sp. JCM 10914]GAE06982.1 transcriptional regulator, TetR family [Paenibacillus sp. JCM 10914]
MSLANPSDPRARRTRKYIQNAFTDLLAEKDFEAISIQDIMDRAGLNRATFYNHYQDKYEWLELTLNEAFTDILSTWIPPGTVMQGPELLRRLMMAVCEWQIETTKRLNSRRTLSHMMEEVAKQQLYNVIISCLTNVKDIPVQEQRTLERSATMISWSIYGVIVKWSHTQEEPAEVLIEQVLPILMSNLRTLDFMDGE